MFEGIAQASVDQATSTISPGSCRLGMLGLQSEQLCGYHPYIDDNIKEKLSNKQSCHKAAVLTLACPASLRSTAAPSRTTRRQCGTAPARVRMKCIASKDLLLSYQAELCRPPSLPSMINGCSSPVRFPCGYRRLSVPVPVTLSGVHSASRRYI